MENDSVCLVVCSEMTTVFLVFFLLQRDYVRFAYLYDLILFKVSSIYHTHIIEDLQGFTSSFLINQRV